MDRLNLYNQGSVDLALVGELQRDGRLPFTELGSKLGVSHGTVRNRLERLLARGVIRRVAAIVDPAKVGFPTQVIIGISADLKRMLTIEKELARFDEVYFVCTSTGRLDFFVLAAFASDSDLRDFLARRLSTVEGVRATETSHILSIGKLNYEWRIPGKEGPSSRSKVIRK